MIYDGDSQAAQCNYNPLPQHEQHTHNNPTSMQNEDGPSSTPVNPVDAAERGSSTSVDLAAKDLVNAKNCASQKRVVQNTCLIAMGISITLVGMMVAFFSFICVFHQCKFSELSIVSTAPLGRVLTISQVTSHIATLSVPIIMGPFSYLLSVQWLKSSADGGPNRPSPMQYVWILDFHFPSNILKAGPLDGNVQWRRTFFARFLSQIRL
jgi:hypothetical protein